MTGEESPPERPRIVMAGSDSAFTAHAVRALCEAGAPPVAVMAGAGSATSTSGPIPLQVDTPVADIASANRITLLRTPNPNTPDAVAALERLHPDLLLLACLPHLVGRAARRTARLGALNLHPSALPRFRGPDPVFWQLRAGARRAGVTVHVATDALDTGPIVVQRFREVEPGVRADALTAALVRTAIQALVERLPDIEDRIRRAVPQDDSDATWQPRPRPEDFRLDTSWTAERAYRFVEGVRGPGTRFTVLADDGGIEIERAIGFDTRARSSRAVRRHDGIVTIRFAEGLLRAVPAPASGH